MRSLLARGALVVLLVCGTPLASARILGVPGDITAEATGPSGAVVTYDAGSFACTPPSGSTFPLGTTPVDCVDEVGNPGGSFNVTVVDTTPPVVTPPADVSVTTENLGGTTVTYPDATATDTVAGPLPATCLPASGSSFSVGTTVVTCSATDGFSNTGTATFTVTVTLVDRTPPVLSLPGPITAEATGPSGASVTFTVTASDAIDPAPTVSCSPASGATFPLGPTTVTCTATDASGNTSAPASFTITVVDTTPPVVTPPADVSVTTENLGGTTVTYPDATATDTVAGPLPAPCLPAPGSSFSVGTTLVTCSATDGFSNTGAATFTVTVTLVDKTPPVLSLPGPITAEATGPSGASVTFTVTASDAIDPGPTVSCDHASGTTFALGPSTVTCTATDASGNTSAPGTFTITVVDTTSPVISVPANLSAEATGPSGAAVSYPVVTATDIVEGTITANCLPAPGSTFHLGVNTVTCNATDSRGNRAAPQTFTITVNDTTGPAFSGVPAPITAEANGPAGSTVNYTSPTAVDLVDGPIASVTCAPASGSMFPLGTTRVTCNASDSRGNPQSARFDITVADTTPPTLVIPVALGVRATGPDGVPRKDVSGFLESASASDIVDPDPVITHDAPAILPLGTTDVNFTARDASGNATSRSSAIVVLPQPPPGAPPLVTPPAPRQPDNPNSVKVTPGDGKVTLVWARVSGAKRYLVYRSERVQPRFAAVGHGELVYSGTATTFTDRGLQNGVEYRYVVVVEDAAGNQSAGVAIVVVPRQDLLKSPKNGARLRKPPRLVWRADGEADYYNAQLMIAGVKVLSVWPTRAQFQLKKRWKFLGKKYTLKTGLYTWYVWPGYGAREAVDYGELMGSRTFRIVR